MTKAEKHLFEAEKSVKKARRHLARILIDECEGSELLLEDHPGLRRSARWLEEVLDDLVLGEYPAAGNLAPTVGEDGVARWGSGPAYAEAFR